MLHFLWVGRSRQRSPFFSLVFRQHAWLTRTQDTARIECENSALVSRARSGCVRSAVPRSSSPVSRIPITRIFSSSQRSVSIIDIRCSKSVGFPLPCFLAHPRTVCVRTPEIPPTHLGSGELGADRPDLGGRKPRGEGLATNKKKKNREMPFSP